MAIVQTINEDGFINAFIDIRPDSFTILGLRNLYTHLNEVSESLGESIEFDVIAICCDYTEYTFAELINEYGYVVQHEEYEDDEEYKTALLEEIRKNTTIIECDQHDSESTYIIRDF